MENGERDLKAWELSKIAQVLHVDMTTFFPKVESAVRPPVVLWRQRPENNARLEAAFLNLCKDYKFVEELNSVQLDGFRKLPKKQIDLDSFRYGDVYALAEEVRSELDLGDYPATSLIKVLEEKYGIKFFFNELDGNGSAASSVSDYGSCILISSSEASWRQHFSIAHELFHIVTWGEALLDQVTTNQETWEKNERFANAFAAGLLVPAEPLHREIRSYLRDGKLNDGEIVAIARQFGVSLEALLWRMVNLRIVTKDIVEKSLEDSQLRSIDHESRASDQKPYHLSNRFVRMAYVAYKNGEISRSRLAKMLNQTLSGLEKYLGQFGLVEVGSNEISLSYP